MKTMSKSIMALILFIFVIVLVPIGIWPQESADLIGRIYDWMTMDYAWLFLLFGAGCCILALFFSFSRYGDIRLGGKDARPDYTTFHWIAMNLCSALAAGILIFGMCEWMSYVQGTPFGIEPYSTEAYEYASAYGMFHWGFTAWPILVIPAITIGYQYWNGKSGILNVSCACGKVIGERNKSSIIGKLLNGIVAFAIAGSLAATIGLGTPIIAEILSALFGMENTFGLRIIVICALCLFFLLSSSKSIAKGMEIISDFNVKLGIVFLVFVFLVGPKIFTLNNFTMAIGKNLDEFIRMSFYTDAIAKTGFIQGWTVFYWSWYVSQSILEGLWVAQVSKGRTLREICIAVCIWSPIACWGTFGVLTNYGMNLELTGQVMLSQIAAESGNNVAVLEVLKTLPLSQIAMFVFMILIFLNLATSCTSNATVVATLSSKNLKYGEEPNKFLKVVWACLFLAIPVSLLFLERVVPGLSLLETLQSVTTVVAIPMFFVCVLIGVSFYRSLKEDIKSGKILEFVSDDAAAKWPEALNSGKEADVVK